MTEAIWNGVTLAQSSDVALVEGNAYFPADAVDWSHLRESIEVRAAYCHWKGFAKYCDVVASDAENKGAAWRYDEPHAEASIIQGRVAFWRGVEVLGAPAGVGLVETVPSLRNGKTGWEALCWLLSMSARTGRTELSASEVAENTGILEADLEPAWQVYDVERYATNYRWRLVGGGGTGEPIRLVHSA